MASNRLDQSAAATASRTYPDLHDHLARLEQAGLLYRIDEPVNKDTEMHPLVRWQFRGGIAEPDRKAFLFTNIVDSKGRRYDIPVVIGAYAANAEIYRLGLGVDKLEDIGPAWTNAIAKPIPPRLVETGVCQEIVIEGKDLEGPGNGLESLPVPISTPGFDAAPYFTATGCITKDPETGVHNIGTYRGHLKSPTRLGMMMDAKNGSGGYQNLLKYKAMRKPMPIAIVLGAPPLVGYQGPQKLPHGFDELGVAGALAGGPINVVRARTVDLLVPAEAEVVIEGYVDQDYFEPEGPFGESHGHVALEDYNPVITVTAITRRRDAVMMSIISQVTPSESSVVKRLAYEPLFLSHLRDHLGIKGVKRVVMHEPLTNLRKFIFIQFAAGTRQTEIWRALHGVITLHANVGKFVVAIDEDIDPNNADAIFWAISYRCNPIDDMLIVPHRWAGHAPRTEEVQKPDSSVLVDATMKEPLPPVALPKREYMEGAKVLWEKLGLPKLTPEMPWYGYSLGDWTEEWDRNALQATRGEWMQRSESYRQRRRSDIPPNTPVRSVEGKDD